MFYNHHPDAFKIDHAPRVSVTEDAVDHWDMGLMRKMAEAERSKYFRQMLASFVRYLGDLAESRHSVR